MQSPIRTLFVMISLYCKKKNPSHINIFIWTYRLRNLWKLPTWNSLLSWKYYFVKCSLTWIGVGEICVLESGDKGNCYSEEFTRTGIAIEFLFFSYLLKKTRPARTSLIFITRVRKSGSIYCMQTATHFQINW